MESMAAKSRSSGFSLIELMITVAVIGIVSAIAFPIFTDYLDTASEGVMRSNIETIRLFQEDYRLAEGAYASGTYDPSDPDASGGLKDVIGWEPKTSEDNITYVVDNASRTAFRVTATDENGKVVVVNYP